MKSDEIYRQKPINRQNYEFSQKLILYICTQTINTYHYGAEKDRTYNIASDCFWYNRHHWCFSPPNRTSLWLGRVQQLPYFGGMLHYHGSYLSQSAMVFSQILSPTIEKCFMRFECYRNKAVVVEVPAVNSELAESAINSEPIILSLNPKLKSKLHLT